MAGSSPSFDDRSILLPLLPLEVVVLGEVLPECLYEVVLQVLVLLGKGVVALLAGGGGDGVVVEDSFVGTDFLDCPTRSLAKTGLG